MTKGLLAQLDTCLGELAKRALRWPKHFSNTAAVMALEVESARSRLLVRKLGFLRQILIDGGTGVGHAVLKSMVDDVNSLCLVRECRELEESFGTHFTDDILCGKADQISMKEMKKVIRQLDKEKRLKLCEGKAPLIAALAKKTSWLKLWDIALDLGLQHTRGLQALSRLMSHHG